MPSLDRPLELIVLHCRRRRHVSVQISGDGFLEVHCRSCRPNTETEVFHRWQIIDGVVIRLGDRLEERKTA